MIQAGGWLSRTQMWWTGSCRGFSSTLWQHSQQPLSCSSRLRDGTCPPLLTLFKSPAEALWALQYRKALNHVSPEEGHQHQSCDQGLEHRMHERGAGKGGTFLQQSQSCSSESCPVGGEEPADPSQHRKVLVWEENVFDHDSGQAWGDGFPW